jgi:hypothetical protein
MGIVFWHIVQTFQIADCGREGILNTSKLKKTTIPMMKDLRDP